ncbi:3625_t:CDS:1, partial [Gigaspora rosea]
MCWNAIRSVSNLRFIQNARINSNRIQNTTTDKEQKEKPIFLILFPLRSLRQFKLSLLAKNMFLKDSVE